MSRRISWLLVGLTVVVAPVGAVLGVIGAQRGLDLPPGRESKLFIELIAAVGSILFAAVGALIARSQPANPIGWIFLGAALPLALTGAGYGYADLALYGGESWPGGVWAGWLASWLVIVPVFVGPCLVAQLFPDGRPLPSRWRFVLRLSLGLGSYLALAPALQPGTLGSYPTIENPAGLPGPAGAVLVDPTWAVAILLLLVLSFAAVAIRFRRSRGIERQQLRWLALASGVIIAALLLTFVVGDPLGGLWATVFSAVGLSAFALLPVAVAVAILRYRLYEIDRIVSRTLVYASLTVVLGAAYGGLVLAGQAVFSSFAGGSNLAIAVSTLVVAALFLPARSRVQSVVDRRFYRRRYDAQRTLEAFGARLRDQVELQALSSDLRAVVQETMQPAHVSLWLREAPR